MNTNQFFSEILTKLNINLDYQLSHGTKGDIQDLRSRIDIIETIRQPLIDIEDNRIAEYRLLVLEIKELYRDTRIAENKAQMGNSLSNFLIRTDFTAIGTHIGHPSDD